MYNILAVLCEIGTVLTISNPNTRRKNKVEKT